MATSTPLLTGGCQCGKVRFEVSAAIESVADCNCSMCGRKGILMAFMPAASFKLLKGEESLTDYRFNKKQIAHLFCSTCGIHSFGRGQMPDGSKMVVVNVRCLDGFDYSKLPVEHYDGASF